MLLEHAPERYREVVRQALDEVEAIFTEARRHNREGYTQGLSLGRTNLQCGVPLEWCKPMLFVMLAERLRTTIARMAKVRVSMASPVEVGTMVKASFFPAHLVNSTVRVRTLQEVE